MKTLITGATGFVGGALARRLHAQSADVTALGRHPIAGKQLQEDGIRFLRADLADKQAITAACAEQDIVFHCGAFCSPWGPYRDFYASNVTGTEHIIHGCQEHDVSRLIYVSTPSLYFTYDTRLNVSERDPLADKQVNFYTQTKLLAEKAIDSAQHAGLPVITIRPRAIFGPGDRTILPRLISRLEQGRLPIIGDESNLIDLTYIDNVVDALLLCANAPSSTLGKKYNITNGEPVNLWHMVQRLCTELNLPYPRQKIPFRLAFMLAWGMEIASRTLLNNKEPLLTRYTVSVLAKSATLDISAARRELGYKANVSVEEGVERFVAWWVESSKNLS